jgi:SAM-dependent methyltransferase
VGKMTARLRLGGAPKRVRQTGDEHVMKGREPTQMGWYAFASTLVAGQTVVDVGCGSGEGLKLLAAKAQRAVGIDLDERLMRRDLDIRITDISQLPDNSFDVVVCIDVIEHVEDDEAFVKQLARVARRLLFVSTPNYAVHRNLHPYHVREYTPYEFKRLFSSYGRVALFGGSSTGETRQEITRRYSYYLVNALYTFNLTILLAKVLKRILLMKVWPHQAVIVTIPGTNTTN